VEKRGHPNRGIQKDVKGKSERVHKKKGEFESELQKQQKKGGGNPKKKYELERSFVWF